MPDNIFKIKCQKFWFTSKILLHFLLLFRYIFFFFLYFYEIWISSPASKIRSPLLCSISMSHKISAHHDILVLLLQHNNISCCFRLQECWYLCRWAIKCASHPYTPMCKSHCVPTTSSKNKLTSTTLRIIFVSQYVPPATSNTF